MNSRKLLIGCGIVLALGLGIALIGIIASYIFPKQASPGAFSTLVNINLPMNGGELPLNEPVSIYAEAVSDQPVHDLELWLDGAFSPTKMDSSPVDQSLLNAVWLWTPTEEGTHRLIVRAIGPGGEVVNSNVVHVSVLPRDKIADLQVTDIPAESLPPVETPAADVAFLPPEGPAATPPPPPFPPEDQPQNPADPPAGAPGLQGSINQCDATLLIQDTAGDEQGFYLYRIDPTSAGFTRVATLDKHAGTGSFNYLDPGLSLGDHTYYIASFDGTGESVSNMISLKVTDAQCAGNGPQALGLKDAILTTTKAVDKVYCYLSVNQGPWTRIPPGSNKFINPTAGGFDLSKYLTTLISPPPPGGVTLEMECWGWSGNTLTYLGYLKQTIDKGPVKLIGLDFDLIGKLGISGPVTFPFSTNPHIAPPFSVSMTNDLGKCKSILTGFYTQSTAASFCKKFLENGQSILSWKWMPYCFAPSKNCPYNVKDIDGYHVYQVYLGGNPQQISNSTNGPSLNFVNITPTGSGVYIPPQYFVRAYKGTDESGDSVHVKTIPPKNTVMLTPSSVFEQEAMRYGTSLTDLEDTLEDTVLGDNDDIWVGFRFGHGNDGNVGEYWISQYTDAHLGFDLSEIKSKGSVISATLRWKIKAADVEGIGAAGASKGCLIPLVDRNLSIIANYPLKEEQDVTTQVRSWVVQGQGNPPTIIKSGFIFLSGFRQLVISDTRSACRLKLGDFKLEVSTTQP